MKVLMAISFIVGAVFTAPCAYLLGDFTGTQETQRTERLIAQAEAARAARDAAQRDLQAATIMATIQRDNAEANRKAALDAEAMLHDYEQELLKRGDGSACALTPADIGRLRQYGIGSDHTAAPAK